MSTDLKKHRKRFTFNRVLSTAVNSSVQLLNNQYQLYFCDVSGCKLVIFWLSCVVTKIKFNILLLFRLKSPWKFEYQPYFLGILSTKHYKGLFFFLNLPNKSKVYCNKCRFMVKTCRLDDRVMLSGKVSAQYAECLGFESLSGHNFSSVIIGTKCK